MTDKEIKECQFFDEDNYIYNLIGDKMQDEPKCSAYSTEYDTELCEKYPNCYYKQLLATQKKLEEQTVLYEKCTCPHFHEGNCSNDFAEYEELKQKLDKAEAENKIMREGLESISKDFNKSHHKYCYIAKTALENIGEDFIGRWGFDRSEFIFDEDSI